jgi:hypothetical protein
MNGKNIHKKVRSSSESSTDIAESPVALSFKAMRAISVVINTKSLLFFLIDLTYALVAAPQLSRENRYGALVSLPVALLRTFGSLMFILLRDVDAKTSSALISPSLMSVRARSSYGN